MVELAPVHGPPHCPEQPGLVPAKESHPSDAMEPDLWGPSGWAALPAGLLSLMLFGKSFLHLEGFNEDILYGFLGGIP